MRSIPPSIRLKTLLRELETNSSDYHLDFWRRPSNINHTVDLMLAQHHRKNVERQLHYQNIHYEEIIDSVERFAEKIFKI